MIGQPTPGQFTETLTGFRYSTAIKDPIDRQHGAPDGEGPGRTLGQRFENIDYSKPRLHQAFNVSGPVVEVPGDDQGGLAGYMRMDPFVQDRELPVLFRGDKPKVDADDMDVLATWALYDSMEHAPACITARRDIDVLPRDKRIFAQDRIAMVPLMVDGIFAVSIMGP